MNLVDAARKKLQGQQRERTNIGDLEIRKWVYGNFFCPGVFAIDEFGIAEGRARADLAYLVQGEHGLLGGIEIKSNLDTIKRLANQSLHYTQFFDCCDIVVGQKFINHAISHIPVEWGILGVSFEAARGAISGQRIRAARPNSINYYRWLELLWREEVLNHFRADSSHSNLTRVTKEELVEVWKSRHTQTETKPIVLSILENRKDWRRRDPGTLHRL